jgi:capsular polysaccharide biosynthesis protein
MEQAVIDPVAIAQSVRRDLTSLVDEGRMADARTLATAAREAFPQDPDFATRQAYIHLRLGSSQLAVDAAHEARALGSEDPQVEMILGLAARLQQRHAEAAEHLLVAHRLMPERANVWRFAVEESFAAHGIEATRPVFDEVFARTKDPVVAQFWAERLFEAGLHAEMPPGMASARVTTARAWAEISGGAPEFVGATEIMTVQDPPVFGELAGETPIVRVEGYTPYAATVRGATVFSRSSVVLTDDGAAQNDTIADPRFGRFLDLSFDKLVVRRDGERLLLNTAQYAAAELPAGIMLSGWASEHFGHWVPEYLCRLAYLEEHPRFADLPIIVDAGMPAQHLEFLRLLVPNPIVEVPEGGALHLGELVVASPSIFFPVLLVPDHEVPAEHQGGLPIGGFRYLQERVRARLAPDGRSGRKLYLSRKSRTWRRLLNEDEVAEALAARGFEVLYPEEMSLEDQVRMYQGASLVVAPNGSSLLNAIFAPTDLKLLVLSQRGLFNWGTYYGLMAELGYELSFFCGDDATDEKHSSYAVPVARLIAAVDEMLG